MSAAPPPAPPSASEIRDVAMRVSYWDIVGAQLKKNRVAMLALWLVLGLVAMAIAAPLIAFNVPIVRASDGAIRLPLLSLLFDRSVFENGVDVFFNLLLLVMPAWLLAPPAGAAFARRGGVAARRSTKASFAIVGLLAVLVVEAWAAFSGRLAIRVAFLGVVVPGAALLAWAGSGRGRLGRARASVRRWVALSILFAGVVVLFSLPTETSPYRIWRGPATTESGFLVFPLVPFHPTSVGDTEALSRARKHPDAKNWLGCDLNGRDVVSRIVFGTRISLTIGVVAVAILVFIGIVLGSLAGFYGGWVDLAVSRFIEVMICFPVIFLLLTIIAVFESRSIFLIMGAIGLVGWPGVARLVRGEFLRQRSLDYVTAARAQGIPQRRIIFRHVLPNCLGPVLVSATLGIAGAILYESSIAFLGLGDQTAVSWGQMLTTGRESQEWHLILVPGFSIFFVVTVFNLLGEGIRDALDPKLRK